MFSPIKGRLTVTAVFAFLVLCMNTSAATAATKVGSVTLEDNISHNGVALVLNGAGIRKKLFFKLYVGSLYIEEAARGADAQWIVQADEPMLIQMNILSDLLTRDKLIKALNDGFRKSTGGNTAPIQSGITAMTEALDQPIRPGDVYQLDYAPGVGTRILRADQTLATIPGLAFKQGVFGIWLSDTPVQASLKKAMLSPR